MTGLSAIVFGVTVAVWAGVDGEGRTAVVASSGLIIFGVIYVAVMTDRR